MVHVASPLRGLPHPIAIGTIFTPMSDAAPLYTLREIAHELDLPESTVRYYRDAFAVYLPTVGTGRRRRYPPEAVDVLRAVAAGFAAGRRRDQIEHELGGAPEPAAAAPVASHAVELNYRSAPLPAQTYEDLLATILDGERERREVMWQMAREIVRLGEAIERQHGLLSEMAEQLARGAAPALPAADTTEAAPDPGLDTAALAAELETLQDQLGQERELVERLRRSRLEFERRATEAEARLSELETRRRGGPFSRRPPTPPDPAAGK